MTEEEQLNEIRQRCFALQDELDHEAAFGDPRCSNLAEFSIVGMPAATAFIRNAPADIDWLLSWVRRSDADAAQPGAEVASKGVGEGASSSGGGESSAPGHTTVLWEDPDQRLSVLNRRSRLLRLCAADLLGRNAPTHAALLEREAQAVAQEAVAHLTDIGASADHGEAYYHEAGILLIGWALNDDDEVTQ